ncbi:MAG: hypothetical protein K2K83_04850, partial [Rikenella sp.]|nr:hypothetical protein [Rikenella sp.]
PVPLGYAKIGVRSKRHRWFRPYSPFSRNKPRFTSARIAATPSGGTQLGGARCVPLLAATRFCPKENRDL